MLIAHRAVRHDIMLIAHCAVCAGNYSYGRRRHRCRHRGCHRGHRRLRRLSLFATVRCFFFFKHFLSILFVVVLSLFFFSNETSGFGFLVT